MRRSGRETRRRGRPAIDTVSFSALLALCLVLLMTGCDNNPIPPKPDPNEIVISDDVFIVDDDEDLTFIEADSTSIVLSYEVNPPDIEVGDILVGGGAGGYLRRVVSVTIDGGTVVVQTSEARLSDVIEEGTLEYQAVLDPWRAMRERGTLEDFKSTALPGVSIDERGWQFSDVVLFDDEIGGVDLEVLLNGTLQFTPDFDLGVEYNVFEGVTEFHTIAEGNIALLLEASANISAALAFGDTVDLFDPVVVGAYPIPSTPLWMDVVIGMEAGFTVTASAGVSAEAGLEGDAGLRVGARWEQATGWESVWEPSAGLEMSAQWGIEAGAAVVVFVRPYIATRLCSAAGPYIGAEPFLRYTIDLTPPPPDDWCWYLDGGVGAGLGFDVTIFGWELFNYYTTLAEYSVSIDSDCDQQPEQTGTIVIDPNPDSLNAPWVLTGPQGDSGNGDETLPDMPAGEYTLTWGAVTGYITPSADVQTLGPDGTITFDVTYEEVPDETGTIIIDPDPDSLNAPWVLTGPRSDSGNGDETLPDMPVGEYTLTWGGVNGYVTPSPNSETRELDAGGILEFAGTYVEEPQAPGMIATWGRNDYGQCDVPSPNTGFVAVAAGGGHSLGLKGDGSIVAWGRNNAGQCTEPSPNAGFSRVAAGASHSLGVKSDGSILAWGWNGYGQCDVSSPNTDFTAVAAGDLHSLGLKSDGSVVAWGDTMEFQCDVPSPNAGFIDVAAGGYHCLGLKGGGTVVAWGSNFSGQCDVPPPNTGFIAVAAEGSYSFGLKNDGSVVAWGDGGYGQCDVPSPNAAFMAVAAGYMHSLGLKNDGSIVAWGDNTYGECTVPSPNAGFVGVAAGGGHSLGLKGD